MKKVLLEYAKKYLSGNPIPFHTPGHKGRGDVFDLGIYDLAKVDIPDNEGEFPRFIEKSEMLATGLYDTVRTFYLVNGATVGVRASFLATVKPEDRVIVGRNLHQSAVSALIETGAVPFYVPVEIDDRGIPLNVNKEKLEEAVKKNPNSTAVFITSPSYHGICADILGLTNIAKKHNKILIVDESWGAHLPFGNDLPPSAIKAGADLVIHGAHKTLPASTSCALLHLNSKRIRSGKVAQALNLSRTTSPNMLLYLFLENALEIMDRRGGQIIKSGIENARKAADVFPANRDRKDCLSILRDMPSQFEIDPLKLLLLIKYPTLDINGYRVKKELVGMGITPEFADVFSLLFLMSGFEKPAWVEKLVGALKKIKNFYNLKIQKGITGFSNIVQSVMIPCQALTPREAFFAPGEMLPLKKSAGRITRSLVVPYPPGIPVLIPGEVISPELIECLEQLISLGGKVRGIFTAKNTTFIEVVSSK